MFRGITMNKNRILKITIAIVVIFIIGISIKNNMNIKHNLIEAKLVIPNGGETFGITSFAQR